MALPEHTAEPGCHGDDQCHAGRDSGAMPTNELGRAIPVTLRTRGDGLVPEMPPHIRRQRLDGRVPPHGVTRERLMHDRFEVPAKAPLQRRRHVGPACQTRRIHFQRAQDLRRVARRQRVRLVP